MRSQGWRSAREFGQRQAGASQREARIPGLVSFTPRGEAPIDSDSSRLTPVSEMSVSMGRHHIPCRRSHCSGIASAWYVPGNPTAGLFILHAFGGDVVDRARGVQGGAAMTAGVAEFVAAFKIGRAHV